ncbi:hypothetical protein BH18ACT8_BH18ACT8_09330 [soil metagenome]
MGTNGERTDAYVGVAAAQRREVVARQQRGATCSGSLPAHPPRNYHSLWRVGTSTTGSRQSRWTEPHE